MSIIPIEHAWLMINENAVMLRWMLKQPETIHALEKTLAGLKIETLVSSSSLDLGTWFHDLHINKAGYFEDSKGNSFKEFNSKWFTAVLVVFRDQQDNQAVSSLIKEIGINSIYLHKSLIKDVGAAIKKTEWWKQHRTEITRMIKRRNVG